MELEQLKQKYAGALEAVQKNNVRLDHLHVKTTNWSCREPHRTRHARTAFGT